MKKNETFFMDVTDKTCPMTTVHVRATLDLMTFGQTMNVLVKGEEARQNVAAAVRALGHQLGEEDIAVAGEGIYCLKITVYGPT